MDDHQSNLLHELGDTAWADPDIAFRMALIGISSLQIFIHSGQHQNVALSAQADAKLGLAALTSLGALYDRASYLSSLATMDYAAYLQTPEWQAKAQLIKMLRGTCAECGATTDLEVHHLTYENRGHEPLEDLRVLCRTHHRAAHGLPAEDPA